MPFIQLYRVSCGVSTVYRSKGTISSNIETLSPIAYVHPFDPIFHLPKKALILVLQIFDVVNNIYNKFHFETE